MAKRSRNFDRHPVATKMMKTNTDEDERLSSLYTTAELWNKLGYYVQREIFAYMDIRFGNECCRVNKLWKNQLVGTKFSNKNIAFLDWRLEKRTQERLTEFFGGTAHWPWRFFFQLHLSGITHFVCIGSMTTAHWETLGKIFAKITLWGSQFTDRDILRVAAALQDKGTLLQIMQCDVQWADYFVSSRYWLVPPSDQLYRSPEIINVQWVVSSSVQCLVFDGTFKEAKGKDEQLQWLHEQFDYSNLIWPYGEDQVEWLRQSLKLLPSLEENVLKDVQRCAHKFYEWSRNQASNLKIMNVKNEHSPVKPTGTELNTLDWAFLGRLISNLPEGQRPEGWKPPPHPFPGNFVCRWRKMNCPYGGQPGEESCTLCDSW